MQNPKETLASCLEIMSLLLTYVDKLKQESSHVFEPKRAPTTKIDFFRALFALKTGERVV